MRVVVQRVSSARIRVEGEEIAAMGRGLLALVGVGQDDTPEVARELARKLVHLRVFDDEQGRMNRSLRDVDGTLGVVSQFTLYGDAHQGRRPSYTAAAPAEVAAPLIEAVAQAARDLGVPVVTGRFQAAMEVALVNAGPVTILMDTQRRF